MQQQATMPTHINNTALTVCTNYTLNGIKLRSKLTNSKLVKVLGMHTLAVQRIRMGRRKDVVAKSNVTVRLVGKHWNPKEHIGAVFSQSEPLLQRRGKDVVGSISAHALGKVSAVAMTE